MVPTIHVSKLVFVSVGEGSLVFNIIILNIVADAFSKVSERKFVIDEQVVVEERQAVVPFHFSHPQVRVQLVNVINRTNKFPQTMTRNLVHQLEK